MSEAARRYEEPGICEHPRTETILNGADVVIGGQCRTCLKVLWGLGDCAGCGRAGQRLHYVTGTQRYCEEQCRKDELARKRAAPK